MIERYAVGGVASGKSGGFLALNWCRGSVHDLSSIVHGAIMAFQALASSRHIGHLYGDVSALIAVAAVLAVLAPRRHA